MRLPSDHQARCAATDMSQSVIIKASAGSGKTALLIMRYLHALMTVASPEEILCITFTNDAAAEIKSRIIDALNLAGTTAPEDNYKRELWSLADQLATRDSELGWNLKSNPSRMNVMTFDAFNSLLSNKLPLLSRLGGPANIEENADILYKEAAQSLLREVHDHDIDTETQEAILNLLKFSGNQQQRILPKITDLLGCRDQWVHSLHQADNDDMEKVIEGIILSRLEQGYRQLERYGVLDALLPILKVASCHEKLNWAAGLNQKPSPSIEALSVWKNMAAMLLTKSSPSLKKKVDSRDGFEAKQDHTKDMNALLANLHEAGASDTLTAILTSIKDLPEPGYPEDSIAFRQHLTRALVRSIAHLELVFETNGKLDFIEVSNRALQALGGEGQYSDVLMNVIDHRIKHIMVDEFQDTNIRQIDLLSFMTDGWEYEDGRTLFMVGDPKQSIYRFREAEVRFFNAIWEEQSFNDVPLKCIELTENFRSDIVPVNWCNKTLACIFPEANDTYISAVQFDNSTAFNDEGSGLVALHPVVGRNEDREAEIATDIIADTLTQHPGDTIAVLVRNRSHLKSLIPSLKQAGIRFSATDIDSIGKRSAALNVIHLIKAMRHAMDRVAWIGLLRSRFVGLTFADSLAVCKQAGKHNPVLTGIYKGLRNNALSQDGMKRAQKLLRAIEQTDQDSTQSNNLPKKVKAIWYALGGPETCSQEEQKDIFTIFKKLESFCEGGQIQNIQAFVASINKLYATPENSNVVLMTIHKSKGLEFDHVIVMGLGQAPRRNDDVLFQHVTTPDGFVVAPNPGKHCDPESPEALLFNALAKLEQAANDEEVKRLIYVALTRAKTSLHLIGHVNHNNKPYAKSLLYYLWPAIEEDYLDAVESTCATATTPNVIEHNHIWTPTIQRIKDIDHLSEIQSSLIPKRSVTYIPSEQTISYDIDKNKADNYHRIIGIVYHQIIESFGHQLLEKGLQINDNQIASRLAYHGIISDQLSQAVVDIKTLVQNTLEDEQGRWIIAPRQTEHNEWKISAFRDNRWISAVLDRAFIEQGTFYIFDYKTTGLLQGEHQRDATIEQAILEYQGQLSDYKQLLSGKIDIPIITGLYFPYYKYMHTFEQADPLTIYQTAAR